MKTGNFREGDIVRFTPEFLAHEGSAGRKDRDYTVTAVIKDGYQLAIDLLDEEGQNEVLHFSHFRLVKAAPTMSFSMQAFPDVSRVELVDNSKRVYTLYGAEDVQLSFQDDGRTLKIFLRTRD